MFYLGYHSTILSASLNFLLTCLHCRFLTYNPPKRITCQEGLYHEYFDKEPPLPIDPAMFPTWPAKSENPHGRSKKTGISPKPPSGGKNFKDLVSLPSVAILFGPSLWGEKFRGIPFVRCFFLKLLFMVLCIILIIGRLHCCLERIAVNILG